MKEIEALFIPLLKQIADPSLQNWKKLHFANVFVNVQNLFLKENVTYKKAFLNER